MANKFGFLGYLMKRNVYFVAAGTAATTEIQVVHSAGNSIQGSLEGPPQKRLRTEDTLTSPLTGKYTACAPTYLCAHCVQRIH